MKILVNFAALVLFTVLLLEPTQPPQDKRGLGIQPSPTPTPAAEILALRNPDKPDLIMQNGHADYVKEVEFTPDGRHLVSASADRSIKVWEVSSGRVVWTLLGHTLPVTSIAISRDGRHLASTEKYGPIRIWDLNTGAALREFAAKKGAIVDIAFGQDGLLHSIGADVDYVWDITTGSDVSSVNRRRKVEKFMKYKEKGVDKVIDVSDHILDFEAIALSEDASRIAVRDKENRVSIRDKTGKQIAQLSEPFAQKPDVMIAAFSPDGKLLALNHSVFSVVVWNTETGARITDATGGGQVIAAAFHPNDQLLAVGTFQGSAKKDKLTLVSLSSGEQPRTFETDVRPSHLAFTKDARLLALGGGESLGLWDVKQDKLLRAMRGGVQKVQAIAISPDGRLLATAVNRNAPRFWDLNSGDEIGSIAEPPSSLPPGSATIVEKVSFSPDGESFAVARSFFEKSMHLYETSSRTPKLQVPGTTHVAFSPDGSKFATLWKESVKVFETGTGREILNWAPKYTKYRRQPHALAFSPDGRWLAALDVNHLALWDLKAGLETSVFPPDRGLVGFVSHTDMAFTPDGRLLAIAGDGGPGVVSLFDPETGQHIRRINAHQAKTSDVVFLNKGARFISSSFTGEIRIWETATGAQLKSINGNPGGIVELAVSPDDRWFASVGHDGATRIWDTNSGEQLLLLTSDPETSSQWVAVTPDGLFDGSLQGINQLVAWRFGNETLPLETFFNEFYYPGLIAEVLAGKRPKPVKDISLIDRRQPSITLTTAADSSVAYTSRTIQLKINVSESPADAKHSNGSGAHDVRLFRNGSLVKVWRGDVLKGRNNVALETSTTIVAGKNRFTAYAFNRDNIKSSDANLIVAGAETLNRKGVAYVLTIGVNAYANPEYNLKYAVADARDFAEEWKLQQTKLARYERIEVLSLNDQAASKSAILKAIADLSKKTQPEDAVIIFFAGHGTAQGNRFYLIPHDLGYRGSRTQLDEAGLQAILMNSISDEALELAVEGLDAAQLLLVIDACNSGQALEAEEKRRGPMNSKGLAQLAYEKGMYVLTAAQGYQAALEAAQLGHGYLTYALVEEGLKTKSADTAPADGQVLIREWLDYATSRVPQMQQNKIQEQQKQGRQLEMVLKFAESDTGTQRSVQRPRVFYRREVEINPLVVAKP